MLSRERERQSAKSVKFPYDEFVADARTEAEPGGRTTLKEQIMDWARFGRAIENSESFDFSKIKRVLAAKNEASHIRVARCRTAAHSPTNAWHNDPINHRKHRGRPTRARMLKAARIRPSFVVRRTAEQCPFATFWRRAA